MRLQILGATPQQIADDLGMKPASAAPGYRHGLYDRAATTRLNRGPTDRC